MLENAIYSVISPEGCAGILWKDAQKAPEAAEFLHITAEDMVKFGVAERIVEEDFRHFRTMCKVLKSQLQEDLTALNAVPADTLLLNRYNRFRKIGEFSEEIKKNSQ